MAYFFTSNKTKHNESDGGLVLYVFVYIYLNLPHPYPTVPASALSSPGRQGQTDNLLRHLSEALGYRLPGGGRTRK